MAHFARLDENNIVTQVIVVHNNECLDANGNESEVVGINFCNNLLGGVWKQTSYNGKMRKNYAGIGYTYDENRDAFIPPKPYASWQLNEDTCLWNPPIPKPDDGNFYTWNEITVSWDQPE
jgi:hypothetical protein